MTNFNNTDTRNFLTLKEYVISEVLQESLESGKLQKDFSMTRKLDTFHIVKINIIDSNILVYSHISYHIMFLKTFLYFLQGRSNLMGVTHKEPGNFLAILDRGLWDPSGLDEDKLSLAKAWYTFSRLVEGLSKGCITNNVIFRLIDRLIIHVYVDSMSLLVDLAVKRDYKTFTKEVLGSIENYDSISSKWFTDDVAEAISIINGCLFIVNDIEKFIVDIRNRGYNINAGPQKQRALVSSINSFLSILDMDYRRSLYYHNKYHTLKGSIDIGYKLPSSKFSFNNIHMNIGGVRWYSSRSSRNSADYKKKYSTGHISTCFTELASLYQTRDHNEELQLYIEKYLFNSKNVYCNSINDANINYGQESSKYVMGKTQELTKILERDYSEVDSNYGNPKWTFYKNLRLTSEIVNGLGAKNIANIVITYFLTLLTMEKLGKNFGMKSILYESDYTPLEDGDEGDMDIEDIEIGYKPIREVYCYSQLGNTLFNQYRHKLYNNDDANKKYKYFEWCNLDDVKNNLNRFKEDVGTLTGIGGNILFALTQPPISLIHTSVLKIAKNRACRVINIEAEASKIMIKDNVTSLPYKLPMIVKPKPYELINGELSYGGYLLNGDAYTETLIIPKPLYNIATRVEEPQSVLQMVNDMSNVPYIINIETLDYILKFGKSKGILIDRERDILPILTNKKDIIKVKSTLSKYTMENLIMEIAQTYTLVNKFYFPIRLDNRTRLYADCEYFNYQTTDLAKSLLLFANSDFIYKHDDSAKKYFKSYGAILFGGNNSKKSLDKRVQWVDDNSDKILNFQNNDIISKAKDKASFVSFCFEYKRFKLFMDDINRSRFETRLPIQVDASCNGYQHLSLLTRDENGLKYLNLNKSSHGDDPHDLYTLIIYKFKELITSDIEKGNYNNQCVKRSLEKILSMGLTREEVKPPIMVFAYNAKAKTMTYYLSDKMDTQVVEKKIPTPGKPGETTTQSYKLFYLPGSTGEEGGLEWKELCLIISYIKRAISEYIPKMDGLNNYMKSLVKICTRFGIPLPRKLPNGAVVSESYVKSKDQKSTPIAFLNKTSYTFKAVVKDESGKVVYNNGKMSMAIMPNVVHSLDASAIAILYDFLKASRDSRNTNNIYTVHDCFAMTANNIKRLVECLQNTYINMYSDNVYLLEMDKYVRNHIEQSLNTKFTEDGDKFKNPKTGRHIRFPDVNDVINTKISVVDVRDSTNVLI